MTAQVFMSHTKLDKDYCDRFDRAAPRVGVKVFRSEFEDLQDPAWKTIKKEINKSSALFLLVGKELVKAQELSSTDDIAKESWKHTQNWISYEIGVACQLDIDVWVICDDVPINFPVPYLNNYGIWGINPEYKPSLDFIKWVLTKYVEGQRLNVGYDERKRFECPQCKAIYNLHSILPKGMITNCPSCLKSISFPNGWGLDET